MSQAKSQPSEAAEQARQRRELARRIKEVEEREAAISVREDRLADGQHESQHELRILEGKIIARQSELGMIEAEIRDKTDKVASSEHEARRKLAIAQEEQATAERLAKTRADELEEVNLRLRASKRNLRDVDEELASRTRYLSEQEQVIEKTLNDGNDSIRDANRELGVLEKEREEVLRQTYTLKADLGRAEERLTEVEDKIRLLNERYEVMAGKYRVELVNIKAEANEKLLQKEQVDKELNTKAEELRQKEQELATKADVLDKKANEVAAEIRKLESKKALYGVY